MATIPAPDYLFLFLAALLLRVRQLPRKGRCFQHREHREQPQLQWSWQVHLAQPVQHFSLTSQSFPLCYHIPMKTGFPLLLILLGAILAFAVTAHTPGLNLHLAGAVVVVVGVLGIAIPRTRRWASGRRVVLRRRNIRGNMSLDPPPVSYHVDPPPLSELQPGDITAAQDMQDMLNERDSKD